MSNYIPRQNGLNIDIISRQNYPSDNNQSKTQKAVHNSFRCHTGFVLLFFFQIISTILMLISLSFTVEMISAEQFTINVTSVLSGNIHNEFEEILNRFRRLSEKKTFILNEDNAKKACTKPYYYSRFEDIFNMRMSYCNMFDVNTIIYPFLYNDSDFISVSADVHFPTHESKIPEVHNIISKIPSQILIITHLGEIRASYKSTQNLILSHFSNSTNCNTVLSKMIAVDQYVRDAVQFFKETLVKQYCNVTSKKGRLKWGIDCYTCELAYKNWLCTQHFDMFSSIIPSTDNKENKSALIGIKSCPSWCSTVEKDCVYFTPAVGNGGEPAFLCDESHYHHNARYRLSKKAECGADLPWKFCCYSQSLLDKVQRPSMTFNDNNCSTPQSNCLEKLIKAVYQMKGSPPSILRTTSVHRKHASSLNCQVNLIIFIIISLFLYFYTDFSIR